MPEINKNRNLSESKVELKYHPTKLSDALFKLLPDIKKQSTNILSSGSRSILSLKNQEDNLIIKRDKLFSAEETMSWMLFKEFPNLTHTSAFLPDTVTIQHEKFNILDSKHNVSITVEQPETDIVIILKHIPNFSKDNSLLNEAFYLENDLKAFLTNEKSESIISALFRFMRNTIYDNI